MTVRDDLLGVVDGARALVEGFGLRPRSVTVRAVSQTVSGFDVTVTTTDTEISPRPKVVDLTRDASFVGGVVEQGDYLVRKISGTYARAELDLGGDSYWVIGEGPDGEAAVPCRLVKLELRNFEWRAILRRMDRA